VNDSQLVEIVQSQSHLAEVKQGHFLFKIEDIVQQRLEVAAYHVLHDQIDAFLGLKGVEELDHKRRFGHSQGVAFSDNLLGHVFVDHHLLIHDFDRINLLVFLEVFVLFALAKIDLAEAA